MNRKIVILAVLLGVVACSLSGPLIKLCLNMGAAPPAVAFWRLLFAAVLSLSISCARPETRAQLFHIRAANFRRIGVAGFFLALHFLTWIPSLSLTGTFTSVVLVCTQPIFTYIGGRLFLGETHAKGTFWAILLAFSGVCIIALGAGETNTGDSSSREVLWGGGLALAGALFASVYFLSGHKARREMPIMNYMGLVYLLAAALLLITCLATGAALLPPDSRVWPVLLLLALVCTLGGHTVLNWVQRFLPATLVSAALLGESLGSAVWARLFFGESVGLVTGLGGGIIIAGILLLFYLARSHPAPEGALE